MAGRNTEEIALKALADWFDYEHAHQKGQSDRYIVCAGLAVLEVLKIRFPIKKSHYITDKNQVKVGGPLIRQILKAQGEERRYATEAGRTTRGTRPVAERLVKNLNKLAAVGSISNTERAQLADKMQGWLVDHGVRPYFERRQIDVEINLQKSGSDIVGDILKAAAQRNVAGAVAHHLVGAKLSVRYPEKQLPNRSYTTADLPSGQPGDYLVGDTAFHVTVAPMQALLDKCAENIRNGYRAFLLVSESTVEAAKQMANMAGLSGRIGIFSIEHFVGQNIEEIGEFGREGLSVNIKALLEKYNERVAEVETDRSLLIRLPENL